MKYYQYNSLTRQFVEVRSHHYEKRRRIPFRGMSHEQIKEIMLSNLTEDERTKWEQRQ